MITVFPVRHLSPCGALEVVKALDAAAPDIVLLEIPCDMTPYLALLTNPDTRPPVALCAYDRSAPSKAVFLPIGESSPELWALRWCAQNGVEARGMDLPSRRFVSGRAPLPPGAASAYERFAVMSGESGFDDFWERNFEHTTGGYSEAVAAFGETLRQLAPPDAFFLERESFMQGQITRAEREGRVMAICGAYHAQALAAGDAQGAVPPAVPGYSYCLVPYSHERLCSSGGYGGGNESPRYHELILKNCGNRMRASAELIAEICGRLRGDGHKAGAADTLECLTLARSLAAVRSGGLPVLSELRAAAGACFLWAEPGELDDAFGEYAVGRSIGCVPAEAGRPPLSEDFHTQHRLLGLGDKITLRLGGASQKDCERSRFLHCLLLMEIPRVEKLPPDPDRSSRREDWRLTYGPETEAALLAMSVKGSSIAEAAENILRSSRPTSPSRLAVKLEWCARCGFFGLLESTATRTDGMSERGGLGEAAAALGVLTRLCGADDSRLSDLLAPVIERLFYRSCADICSGVSLENPSAVLLALGSAAERTENGSGLFTDTLRELAQKGDCAASGCACGLLVRGGDWDCGRLANEISLRLSPVLAGSFSAWSAGYLAVCGEKAKLNLWTGVDKTLELMSDEAFDTALPELRKVFSVLSAAEREKLRAHISENPGNTELELSEEELEALIAFSEWGRGQ